MKGNFHVQFLGEGVAATSPPYPTPGWATTQVYPAREARDDELTPDFHFESGFSAVRLLQRGWWRMWVSICSSACDSGVLSNLVDDGLSGGGLLLLGGNLVLLRDFHGPGTRSAFAIGSRRAWGRPAGHLSLMSRASVRHTGAFPNSARLVRVSCLECVFRVHASVVPPV